MAGDHDKRLNITITNQLKAIWSIFFVLGLTLFIVALLRFNKSAIIIFSIYFLADALPTIYLHWKYYRTNKGEEYMVLYDRLVRWKKGKRDEILSSDIKEIVIRKSASMDKGGIPFLGIESYYCVDVYLKAEMYDDLTLDRLNKPELTLTCFLSPEIDQEVRKLKNVRFERIRSGFNTVKSTTD